MSKPDPKSWKAHAIFGEPSPRTRAQAFSALDREIRRAYRLHGAPRWGRHEALAIIREEYEEAWDVVKVDGPPEDLLKELIQTAAMCVRYIETDPVMQHCMEEIAEGSGEYGVTLPGPDEVDPQELCARFVAQTGEGSKARQWACDRGKGHTGPHTSRTLNELIADQ